MKKKLKMLASVACALGVFVSILFSKYQNNVESEMNDTQINRMEKKVIAGTIYDCNGLVVATGEDVNGRMAYTEDTLIRKSFSNIFGAPIEVASWNSYNLRYVLAPDLYRYKESSLTLKNLFSMKLQGGDVQLTLDMTLNSYIYEMMSRNNYEGGVCVYNYKTGEVRALVSTPSFDLADQTTWVLDTKGKIDPTANSYAATNKTAQEMYPPCSAIKPILYGVIIDQMPELMGVQYDCTGCEVIDGVTVTDHVPHGTIDMQHAIAYSCNPFAVKLGQCISDEVLRSGLQKFEFLDMETFQKIQNEELKQKDVLVDDYYMNYRRGILDNSNTISRVYGMLGQGGTQISVLHLSQCYGAYFNDGVMMKPYIHINSEVQKQCGNQVVSPTSAKVILDGLKLAVTEGTAYQLDLSSYGYTTAGKTGTGDLQQNNTVWCIGGFVDETMLPYVITVCVTSRKSGDTGTDICSPIVRKIMEQLMQTQTVTMQ